MKIINSTFEVREIFFKEPVIVSFGKIDRVKNIFITIELENGIKGFGEISNIEYITNCKFQQITSDLESKLKVLIGKKIEKFKSIISSLKVCNPALCGIDMALYDASAKFKGLTTKELLSPNKRDSISNCFTIGIKDKKETEKEISSLLKQGRSNIKIKVGNNVQNDIEIINHIFKSFKDLKIRIDANQGYNFDQLKQLIDRVDYSRILVIEEPFKKGDFLNLKKAQETWNQINFMADETASTIKDIKMIARLKACRSINIKLVKCGGIKNAIKINQIAKKHGIKSYLGCMAETKLALSAAYNLLLSDDNFIGCDLDSYMFLKNDGEIISNVQFNNDSIMSNYEIKGHGIQKI